MASVLAKGTTTIYNAACELSGQEPVVAKEVYPEIAGIIISASGGGNASVQAEISGAMEALFGLPANKIKVLKRVE